MTDPIAAASATISRSAAETEALGEDLGSLLRAGDLVLLSGDLGAGKTTLVRGVARSLGVATQITSPTFNILVLHRGDLDLAHFDLYRLDAASQLDDIDFWGMTESDAVSVVEWGDKFPGVMREDRLEVVLTSAGDDERSIALCPKGARADEIARAWMRMIESRRAAESTANGSVKQTRGDTSA